MQGTLNAVALDFKGLVYVAGDFSHVGGVEAGGIARWNPVTMQWTDLAGGLLSRGEYLQNLHLLVDTQDWVYASGTFSFAGGQIANGIARWDGETWSNLQGGAMDGEVNAMALDGSGGLYIGGSFTQVGALKSPGIAHWNGQGWENPDDLADLLVEQIGHKPGAVSAIAYDSLRRILYVSGSNQPGNDFFIAAWQENNRSWSNLIQSKYARATILTLGPSGELYAAGNGDFIGGSEGIGLFTQGRWRSLGGGLTLMGGSKAEVRDHGSIQVAPVYATSLVVDRAGQAYLTGHFSAMGGRCINALANWNGGEWRSLGSGVWDPSFFGPPQVNSSAFDPQGNLYIAGGFQAVGGKPVRYLARWTP